jgi:hypothetical protein
MFSSMVEAASRWQWRCGFYPGSGPDECNNGTAASYEAARAAYLSAWRVFLSNGTEAARKTNNVVAGRARR